ncbi:hypothetical protein COOONC_00529 [Cooperia oncophora]
MEFRRVGRKVVYIAGVLATAAVGVIGYAYVNPEARHQVETAVPKAKQILDAILGSSRLKSKQQFSVSQDRTFTAASGEKTEETLSSLTRNLPEPERTPPVHVDPVDVNVPLRTEGTKLDPENAAKRIEELETSLLSAISSAETRVRDATDAKIKTIIALNDHAALFKATVNEPQNADWKKIITDGKKDPATANNPLLLNATETANKLSHQLDELDGLVMKVTLDCIERVRGLSYIFQQIFSMKTNFSEESFDRYYLWPFAIYLVIS